MEASSKIHLAVDDYGLPIDFDITGGEVHDCSAAPVLTAKLPKTDVVIADKGYDSEQIREQISPKGSQVVIPRKRNAIKRNTDLDRELYQYKHLVENTFARLKHYRAFATRFDKWKRNYHSLVAMTCALLLLPM